MFFSVLIPVYNVENYIDRCINSIISQTEKDFEIILVDDGSTDASYLKCKKWEEKYPAKIKAIKKKHSGSLETRRVCLTNSIGNYLYIIDADDYIIDSNALQNIRKNIEKTKSDLVIFNATVDGISKFYHYPFTDGKVYEGESLSEIYKVLLQGMQLRAYPKIR